MPSITVMPTNTLVNVTNIFCIGRNYAKHIQELGNVADEKPVVFLKPTSSVIFEHEKIKLPAFSRNVHHEVELVVLIGKDGRDIPEENAMEYVMAYGVGLDLTARDTQDELKNKGLPWTISKGFDTSACLSRFIEASEFTDPSNIHFTLDVNGTRKQEGNTAMMLFPVPKIISYLSGIFTLHSGDIIFTGTPEGVAQIHSGDELVIDLMGKTSSVFKVA